jgi:hypothetical protein
MGLKSVPITLDSGYWSAVRSQHVLLGMIRRMLTEFNGPDASPSRQVKNTLGFRYRCEMQPSITDDFESIMLKI